MTLSQKIRLALPVCIPVSCFFDQQAVHHKNSKGDIWDFRTELEVSTPYLKTKRTGEDAIPKKKFFFNHNFPRQSVNCYCQDSRRCCEYRLPEKSRLSRPVLPFCPFWLHTLVCLNSPDLHCWLSSHPLCIKMLGFCFRVYVRRSQGAGTDPAKDSMPRARRRGQGLPSDLPKDSLCLHLVVIDCMFVVRKVFGMTLPKTACQGHAIVS